MELIISVAVFSIIMTSIVGIFVGIFSSYSKSRNIDNNLQNAQQAINLIAKSIRTSSVLQCNDGNCVTDSNYSKVKIYDYSQKKCIYYQFASASGKNVLRYLTKDVGDSSTCSADSMNGTPSEIISDGVTGYFRVVPSSKSSARVGRITITMKVTSGYGSKSDTANIQSTLSLRDYVESMP